MDREELNILISTVHEYTSINEQGEIFIAEPDRVDLNKELRDLLE